MRGSKWREGSHLQGGVQVAEHRRQEQARRDGCRQRAPGGARGIRHARRAACEQPRRGEQRQHARQVRGQERP